MSPLSEQFSEARKLQIETQFKLLHDVTGKAFEGAEKLIALNLDTSRASLEQSSNLVRQLIAAKHPRDLLAITSQTPSPLDAMLAYGRRLFGIAAGTATIAAPASAGVPALAAPAPEAIAETALIAEPAPATVPAPAVTIVATPEPEPTFDATRAAEVPLAVQPVVQPAPMASVVSHAETAQPSTASFAVPSSAQPIAVASVKPAAATPPPAAATGTPAIVTTKAALPAAKTARKR